MSDTFHTKMFSSGSSTCTCLRPVFGCVMSLNSFQRSFAADMGGGGGDWRKRGEKRPGGVFGSGRQWWCGAGRLVAVAAVPT